MPAKKTKQKEPVNSTQSEFGDTPKTLAQYLNPETPPHDRIPDPEGWDPYTDGPKAHLVPLNRRTPEERKRIASMGGKASAEKKARNKSFKEAMEWALQLPALKGNPTVERLRKKYPNLDNRDAMAIAMTAEAIQKQNVRAFVAVRDTTGEVPSQSVSVKSDEPMTINIKTIE